MCCRRSPLACIICSLVSISIQLATISCAVAPAKSLCQLCVAAQAWHCDLQAEAPARREPKSTSARVLGCSLLRRRRGANVSRAPVHSAHPGLRGHAAPAAEGQGPAGHRRRGARVAAGKLLPQRRHELACRRADCGCMLACALILLKHEGVLHLLLGTRKPKLGSQIDYRRCMVKL